MLMCSLDVVARDPTRARNHRCAITSCTAYVRQVISLEKIWREIVSATKCVPLNATVVLLFHCCCLNYNNQLRDYCYVWCAPLALSLSKHSEIILKLVNAFLSSAGLVFRMLCVCLIVRLCDWSFIQFVCVREIMPNMTSSCCGTDNGCHCVCSSIRPSAEINWNKKRKIARIIQSIDHIEFHFRIKCPQFLSTLIPAACFVPCQIHLRLREANGHFIRLMGLRD